MEPEFSTQEKKFIEENSNVEIICRIRKNRKEYLQNRLPEMSSAKRPRSRRSRSKSKKFNNTISNSLTRTPKRSKSRSMKRKATTPKASFRRPK